MKRTAKPVFFIVALLIFALTYTAFFGVYTHYGDRRDTIIRGAADIRFGIDIRGGVDVTFAPEDESIEVTADQMNDVRDVIVQRLIRNNITDHEAYADVANKQVIVRFPWKSDEADFDASEAIAELGKTASRISLDFVSHDKDCQYAEGIRERYARHAVFAGSIEGVGDLIRREPPLVKRREVKE